MANFTVRIDDDVKKEAEILFDKLGMSVSGAINIFFRQAIREQGIPFQIKAAITSEQMQARQAFKQVFKEMQEQSVINGTDKMTMDEIDAEIAAYRREKREKNAASNV